jgi:hypothetical protein
MTHMHDLVESHTVLGLTMHVPPAWCISTAPVVFMIAFAIQHSLSVRLHGLCDLHLTCARAVLLTVSIGMGCVAHRCTCWRSDWSPLPLPHQPDP